MYGNCVARCARYGRKVLDRSYPILGGVVIVGLCAGFTWWAAAWESAFLTGNCAPLDIELIRLEVTFSTDRFFAILRSGGEECADAIKWNFVTYDVFFAFCYAVLRSFLYLWTERWR